MWEMTKNSIVLFFRGKLFADPRMVTRQLAIGIVVTAILFVGLAKAGAPLWLAALVAALLLADEVACTADGLQGDGRHGGEALARGGHRRQGFRTGR